MFDARLRGRARRLLFPGLADLALEVARPVGQLRVLRLDEKRVEAATMVDCPQRICRHAQLHRAAERIRDQGDVEEVGQEPPLRLDVGMAYLVTDLSRLAGQIASTRHKMPRNFVKGAPIS